MNRLSGKVGLVTGGARGIGRAIVEAFAREGAAVAILDRPGDPEAVALSQALRVQGVRALALQADVTDENAVGLAVQNALQELGRIDILVNNAGISQRIRFVDMQPSDWDRMIQTDLRSVFLVTHQVVPVMLQSGSGRIINIASQMAQRGAPLLVHYCAAKAGVIGFTKALARELAPNITVNAIAPGPILTDMTKGRDPEWYAQMERELPLGRLGRAEEVAPSAVFLASDEGALYTGQTLGPNLGHVML
ncbi:MAG TPA: 3-oxoacyl-ACP reductase family protein [Anaerolineae bacterium]|nr:3-oxoacyl-ACP reductase family protein [Anaerolineae bacterium]